MCDSLVVHKEHPGACSKKKLSFCPVSTVVLPHRLKTNFTLKCQNDVQLAAYAGWSILLLKSAFGQLRFAIIYDNKR
jgi:hypothetical protein